MDKAKIIGSGMVAFKVIGVIPGGKEAPIEELYNFIHMGAKLIIEDGQEHVPMLFVLTNKGEIGISDAPTIPKDVFIDLLDAIVKKHEFRAIVAVNEAWVGGQPVDNVEEYPYASVADDPDRKEGLIVNILTHGRQALMTCAIDRQARTLSKPEFKWLDQRPGEISGRFVREKPNPDER